MVDFLFKYFLLFPKILITGHWGILIGEIILTIYLAAYFFSKNVIRVNSPWVVYYAFITYFILLTSLIAGVAFSYVPQHAILYYVRLTLYAGVFLWAIEFYKKINSDYELVAKVFNRPFVIHFIICLVIMVLYYGTHSPSRSDILWGYEVGLRMIPLSGLVIDFDSFMFLKAISGSGNLLSGWALAILILNFNLGKNKTRTRMTLIAVSAVLLTISRGGFLTIALFLVYIFFKNFNFKVNLKPFLFATVFALGLIIYFSFSKETPLPNIFERLTDTYQTGKLDYSSQSRLDNYIALFEAWHQKIRYIVFGFGFDEGALYKASNQIIVESFFLEVLFCGGIIGLFALALFYIVAYLNRRKNYWYSSLWMFLVFQSIVSWTITGGDFFAPYATYIFMAFMGFGYAREHTVALHIKEK